MSDFGLLTDGRYFSRSEYENGEKVALIYDVSENEKADFSDSDGDFRYAGYDTSGAEVVGTATAGK